MHTVCSPKERYSDEKRGKDYDKDCNLRCKRQNGTHRSFLYCLENNFAAASELQLKYLRLINDLFMEVNPIPVKEAMNQLGMPSGPCRMPLLDMSDEHKAAMQATLRAYGMLS